MSTARRYIKNMSGLLNYTSKRTKLSLEELIEEVTHNEAEIQDQQADIEVASDTMNTLVEDQGMVDSVSEIVDNSIEEGEGLSTTSALLVQNAVESIMRRHGMPRRTWPRLPSKESFDSNRSRLEATRRLKVSIEEGVFKKIGSSLKKLWEKIKEFFRKIWDKLFGGSSSSTKDLLEEAKEKIEKLKKDNKPLITTSGKWKCKDFDDSAKDIDAHLNDAKTLVDELAKNLEKDLPILEDLYNGKHIGSAKATLIKQRIIDLETKSKDQKFQTLNNLFDEVSSITESEKIFASSETYDDYLGLINDLGGRLPDEKDEKELTKTLDRLTASFDKFSAQNGGKAGGNVSKYANAAKAFYQIVNKMIVLLLKGGNKVGKLIIDLANKSEKAASSSSNTSTNP